MTWKLLPDKKMSMLTQATALSPATCDKIVDTYKGHPSLSIQRNNRYNFECIALDPVEWIQVYEPITSIILDSNIHNYGFKLQGIHAIYYIEFDQSGFMDWNMELMEFSRETAKMSFYVPLNDDFEGGDFTILNPTPKKIPLIKGQMTLIPGFIISKHDAPKKGKKRLLAGVVTGLPFT